MYFEQIRGLNSQFNKFLAQKQYDCINLNTQSYARKIEKLKEYYPYKLTTEARIGNQTINKKGGN